MTFDDEYSYEDQRIEVLSRYLEGDTDNCWDRDCAKQEIEELESRKYRTDHDTD